MTIYFPLIHTNTHNLQGQGPVQVRLILCASLFLPASAGSVGSLARHSTARRYHSSTCPKSSAKRRSRRSKCSLRLALAAAKCHREPTCFGTSQEVGPHGRVPLPLSGEAAGSPRIGTSWRQRGSSSPRGLAGSQNSLVDASLMCSFCCSSDSVRLGVATDICGTQHVTQTVELM